ncbi:MAG: hypothetical protein ABI472_07160 [Ginsengibacter sp.]
MKNSLIKIMTCLVFASFILTGCERRYYEGRDHRPRREHYRHHHVDHLDHDDHDHRN